MARPRRVALGGYVYHMLNRANARLRIFHKDADYAAFERVLDEALEHVPGMRLLSYCLMPNHWHLLLWPRGNGELSDFDHYLTLTHTQRWHAHYHHAGTGHLYQGRFKSFPIEAIKGRSNQRGQRTFSPCLVTHFSLLFARSG